MFHFVSYFELPVMAPDICSCFQATFHRRRADLFVGCNLHLATEGGNKQL